MAKNLLSYENCPTVVYDSDGTLIKRDVIIEYDRRYMTIRIKDSLDDVKNGARINVLIIHSSGVSEFNGTMRGLINNTREISLFNQSHRTGRASARHKINVPAVIKKMMAGAKYMPLPVPLDIVVDNISTTGALIKAPPGYFTVGADVEITITIDDKDTVVYGSVVGEVEDDEGECDFGVKFISPEQ
jgi:hypothetical protein